MLSADILGHQTSHRVRCCEIVAVYLPVSIECWWIALAWSWGWSLEDQFIVQNHERFRYYVMHLFTCQAQQEYHDQDHNQPHPQYAHSNCLLVVGIYFKKSISSHQIRPPRYSYLIGRLDRNSNSADILNLWAFVLLHLISMLCENIIW